MNPNQPEPDQARPNIDDVYPKPTKGSLSDDHSSYAKQRSWKGFDPDKGMKAYFIGFAILMCILFILAVKGLSGGTFWF